MAEQEPSSWRIHDHLAIWDFVNGGGGPERVGYLLCTPASNNTTATPFAPHARKGPDSRNTMDALAGINLRTTPQTVQADPRQAVNNAGGYTFTVTPETRLRRFLTLGSEGTYYVGAKELTQDNAAIVLDFARNRTADLVNEIVTISTAGRAPKQNPALFALAAAASLGDEDGRRTALDALPLVASTGTHLFLFARYIEQFRGWGRGLRKGVAAWYLGKSVGDLAHQMVKYQQREGWSHRDLLRLSHPVSTDDSRRRLFDWACGRGGSLEGLRLVEGYQRAQSAPVKEIPALVREYGLSWEMLPDSAINLPETWEALLENGMPQTALVRQLPRLTRLGLLSPLGEWCGKVTSQLADPARLKKARVHPVNVLVALRTYSSGQSARGESQWQPVAPVISALDAAFYASFGAVEPTGKAHMLAVDVSGSMSWHPISGMPITPKEASAALALVTAAVEPRHEILGFSGELVPLPISPRQRLDDALRVVGNARMGSTDCAQPMMHALKHGLHVDCFVVLTDNETWSGQIHPHQALRQYREQTGINAKLVVVGMTASGLSIAAPGDGGMLDVAGFDSAVPALIADFARGAL